MILSCEREMKRRQDDDEDGFHHANHHTSLLLDHFLSVGGFCAVRENLIQVHRKLLNSIDLFNRINNSYISNTDDDLRE